VGIHTVHHTIFDSLHNEQFRIHPERQVSGHGLSAQADASDSEQSLRSRAVQNLEKSFLAPQARAQRSEATEKNPKNEPRLLKRAQSKRMLWEWQSLQSIVG
jgi:hypothetical protein